LGELVTFYAALTSVTRKLCAAVYSQPISDALDAFACYKFKIGGNTSKTE